MSQDDFLASPSYTDSVSFLNLMTYIFRCADYTQWPFQTHEKVKRLIRGGRDQRGGERSIKSLWITARGGTFRTPSGPILGADCRGLQGSPGEELESNPITKSDVKTDSFYP